MKSKIGIDLSSSRVIFLMSRPLRGAFMRRREGGAGPAPAGVVRSCTPGGPRSNPVGYYRAGLGPGTVECESGKSRWRAGQARFLLGVCSGAPHPLTFGVAMSTEADHDLTRLMIAADEALYRAKAKGGTMSSRR